MSLTTIGILALLAAVSAVGGVFWLRQRNQSEREAFQALAARRGLSLTHSEQKLGRPASLRIASRSGSGWQIEIRRSPTGPVTEFNSEDPHWPEGLLWIGPTDLPPQLPRWTDAHGAAFDPAQFVALPVPVGAEQDRTAAAPDTNTTGGLKAIASHDPGYRFDLADLMHSIGTWADPSGTRAARAPVVIFGPQGLRVRLDQEIKRADRMEAFIDLSLKLARTL